MTQSVDKRSVATDALETLGNIIDESAGGRDAIHIAVEPVIANTNLFPGAHVGITTTDGKTYAVPVAPGVEGVGIVDPFINCPVKPGDMFWLLVYPREITSLRHVWAHPAFDDPTEAPQTSDPKEESIAWIKDYAANLNVGYDDLMDSAGEWIKYEDYMVRGGILEGEHTSDEFWRHFETVTGTRGAGNFFSCSC